jgi:hypothetical protein
MTMHAHTMKATADRANEIAHMIEMKNIDEAIVKAAKEGRYCIHMPISDNWIVRRYQAEGYTVNVTSRADAAYLIKWR